MCVLWAWIFLNHDTGTFFKNEYKDKCSITMFDVAAILVDLSISSRYIQHAAAVAETSTSSATDQSGLSCFGGYRGEGEMEVVVGGRERWRWWGEGGGGGGREVGGGKWWGEGGRDRGGGGRQGGRGWGKGRVRVGWDGVWVRKERGSRAILSCCGALSDFGPDPAGCPFRCCLKSLCGPRSGPVC